MSTSTQMQNMQQNPMDADNQGKLEFTDDAWTEKRHRRLDEQIIRRFTPLGPKWLSNTLLAPKPLSAIKLAILLTIIIRVQTDFTSSRGLVVMDPKFSNLELAFALVSRYSGLSNLLQDAFTTRRFKNVRDLSKTPFFHISIPLSLSHFVQKYLGCQLQKVNGISSLPISYFLQMFSPKRIKRLQI